MLGRWSISERGHSSNSDRHIQWKPGAVSGRWSISERGHSSNSGRRIQWKPGQCRGGGVSASAAPAVAAAFNGSRVRCRGGGVSASAAAAVATAFNGSRGRGRGGRDTATAAVAAAGAGTVGGDRRSGCGDFGDGPVHTGSRRPHRRWNHSRGEVRSGNGGGDIHEGAAGPPGGAVVFARTATAAAVPCDTGGHEIEIESTATGSIKDVYAFCGGGGYRSDSRPVGRSLLTSEELPAGPAHLLETPEMYKQAHVGPHDRIWAKVERLEVERLSAVGTFVEEGEM